MPEGSPAAAFMGAMYSSGYLAFVKILEIAGGVLVAVPKTRNFGLLVLGPIIVNIVAFHVFLLGGGGLSQPPVVLIMLLGLFLLVVGRDVFFKTGFNKLTNNIKNVIYRSVIAWGKTSSNEVWLAASKPASGSCRPCPRDCGQSYLYVFDRGRFAGRDHELAGMERSGAAPGR